MTRTHLAKTGLGDDNASIKLQSQGHQGLVTLKHRGVRRKRFLKGLAFTIGAFPPFWPVSFVTWLVWRNRRKPKSMRLVRKAVTALEKGHTGVALKKLQDAHFLDPGNSDALFWLGLVLSRLDRHEEAAEALSLVAERVPGLPEVEAALVDAYVATGEPDGAVYHAQRLLDVSPHAAGSLLKLAQAFEAADRPELAIQTLEQAPIHKRTLTEGLMEIHYLLGKLYEAQGDVEKALEHFKRVYSRNIAFKDVRERVDALETSDEPENDE